MAEQIITNKNKLPFYSEKEYKYNWDKKLKEKHGTYRFFLPLARFLVTKTKFGNIKFYGMENIPDTGKFILASNHVSGFDPITLMYLMRGKRTMFFMAKEEFFHAFYTKLILLMVNGYPVKRGTSDRSALNFSIRVLNEGFGLLIFPQGTRDKERQRPANGKSGISLIAREAKSDVIPVSIHIESDMEKKKPDIVVRIGKVIPFEELGFSEGEVKSRELKTATQLIMERICELWDMDQI